MGASSSTDSGKQTGGARVRDLIKTAKSKGLAMATKTANAVQMTLDGENVFVDPSRLLQALKAESRQELISAVAHTLEATSNTLGDGKFPEGNQMATELVDAVLGMRNPTDLFTSSTLSQFGNAYRRALLARFLTMAVAGKSGAGEWDAPAFGGVDGWDAPAFGGVDGWDAPAFGGAYGSYMDTCGGGCRCGGAEGLSASSVREYAASLNSTAKNKLADELLQQLNQMVGGKVPTDTPREEKIKALLDLIPRNKITSAPADGIVKVCDLMAKHINKVYGDVIDMGAAPHVKCQQVHEILASLSHGMHAEFLAVHKDIQHAMANLEVLRSTLNEAKKGVDDVINKNTDMNAQTANLRGLQDMITNEMERQMTMLQNLLNITLTPAEKSLMEMIKGTDLLKTNINDIGEDKNNMGFKRNVADILTGFGTTAAFATLIDNALKTVGLTIDQYEKDTNAQKLDQLLAAGLKNHSGDAAYNFLAAGALLRNNLGNRHEIAQRIQALKKGSSEGGADFEDSAIDRRVKTMKATKGLIFKAFYDGITSMFYRLTENLNVMANKIGTEIPFSNELDGANDVLRRIADSLGGDGLAGVTRKNVWYSLIGYHNDALSRSRRDQVLNDLKMLDRYFASISESATYQSTAHHFKEIRSVLAAIVELIDKYSREIAAKFGASDDTCASMETFGSADDDTEGGFDESIFNSTDPLRYKPKHSISDALLRFNYHYRASQVRSNLSGFSKEYKHYAEDYDKLVSNSAATFLRSHHEEYKKYKDTYLKPFNTPADYDTLGAQIGINVAPLEYTTVANGTLPNAKFISDAEKVFDKLWQVKVSFWKTVEGVDTILRKFTDAMITDAQQMQDVKNAMDDMELINDWFSEETGNKFASVFEFFPTGVAAAGAGNAAAAAASAYQFDAAMQEYAKNPVGDYYDAVSKGDAYGNPTIAMPAVHAYKAMERAAEAYKSFAILKNFISVFTHIGGKVGGKNLFKDLFMTPSQMYLNLVDFLSYGQFVLGDQLFNTMTDAKLELKSVAADMFHIKKGPAAATAIVVNDEITAADYGYNAWTNGAAADANDLATKYRAGCVSMAAIGLPANGLLHYERHHLFPLLMKSLAGKVLTVLNLSHVFSHPYEYHGITPIRMIMGGADNANVEIVTDAVELYLRLPLLLEFYRNILSIDNENEFELNAGIPRKDDAVKIAMLPDIDGVYSGLMRLMFIKARGYTQKTFNDDEIRALIKEVNYVYQTKQREHGKSAIRMAIDDLVVEVNRRIGLIDKEERKGYLSEFERQYEDTEAYQLEGVSTEYAILPGEGDDDIVKPSNTERLLSTQISAPGSVKNSRFGISTKYESIINKFRCKIDNLLQYQSDKFSFKDAIANAQTKLQHITNPEERFKAVAALIRGIDVNNKVEAMKTVLFHETVLSGLTLLNGLHAKLQMLSEISAVLHPDTVLKAAKTNPIAFADMATAINAIASTMRIHATAKGVLAEICGQHNDIYANGAAAQQPVDAARSVAVDVLASLTVVRTLAAANPIPPVYRLSIFSQRAMMHRLVEILTVLGNDDTGLMTVKFDNGKIRIQHGELRKFVADLLEQISYFAELLRTSVQDSVYKKIMDKKEIGSLYWLHDNLMDKILIGRPKPLVTEAEAYRNLDAIARDLNDTFEYLTGEHAIRTAHASDGTSTTVAPYKFEYGDVFAELVYYNNLRIDGGFHPSTSSAITAEAKVADVLHNPYESLLFSGTGEKRTLDTRFMSRYEHFYSWDKEFNYNRSAMRSFNQLIAKFVMQFYDTASQKIYGPLIDKFANGAFAKPVQDHLFTFPDMVPGLAIKFKGGKATAESVNKIIEIHKDISGADARAMVDTLVQYIDAFITAKAVGGVAYNFDKFVDDLTVTTASGKLRTKPYCIVTAAPTYDAVVQSDIKSPIIAEFINWMMEEHMGVTVGVGNAPFGGGGSNRQYDFVANDDLWYSGMIVRTAEAGALSTDFGGYDRQTGKFYDDAGVPATAGSAAAKLINLYLHWPNKPFGTVGDLFWPMRRAATTFRNVLSPQIIKGLNNDATLKRMLAGYMIYYGQKSQEFFQRSLSREVIIDYPPAARAAYDAGITAIFGNINVLPEPVIRRFWATFNIVYAECIKLASGLWYCAGRGTDGQIQAEATTTLGMTDPTTAGTTATGATTIRANNVTILLKEIDTAVKRTDHKADFIGSHLPTLEGSTVVNPDVKGYVDPTATDRTLLVDLSAAYNQSQVANMMAIIEYISDHLGIGTNKGSLVIPHRAGKQTIVLHNPAGAAAANYPLTRISALATFIPDASIIFPTVYKYFEYFSATTGGADDFTRSIGWLVRAWRSWTDDMRYKIPIEATYRLSVGASAVQHTYRLGELPAIVHDEAGTEIANAIFVPKMPPMLKAINFGEMKSSIGAALNNAKSATTFAFPRDVRSEADIAGTAGVFTEKGRATTEALLVKRLRSTGAASLTGLITALGTEFGKDVDIAKISDAASIGTLTDTGSTQIKTILKYDEVMSATASSFHRDVGSTGTESLWLLAARNEVITSPYGEAVPAGNINKISGIDPKSTLAKRTTALADLITHNGRNYRDTNRHNILYLSLSIILRNLVSTQNSQGTAKQYSTDNIADIPSYAKEKMRAMLPIFRNWFRELSLRCDLLRKLINSGVNCDVTNIFAQVDNHAGHAVNSDHDIRRHNPWPFVLDANIEGDSKRKTNFVGILEEIMSGCGAMISCCDQGLRDVGDDSKYMELCQGFFKDYKNQNGYDAFAPLSSSLYLLRPINDASAEAETMPIHSIGEVEFKYAYAMHGTIYQHSNEAALDKSHGLQSIAELYNLSSAARYQVNKDKLGAFNTSFIKILRYLNSVRNIRGYFHISMGDAIDPATPNNARDLARSDVTAASKVVAGLSGVSIILDKSTGNVVYQLSTGVGIDDIVSLTESPARDEKIKLLASHVNTDSKIESELSTLNVIDLNIVPINVHALMRSFPLANIYNYSFTFDRLVIELLYGKNTPKLKTILADMCNATKLSSTEYGDTYTLAKLITNPYMEADLIDGDQLTNVLIGSVKIKGLARPKYISDQIYGKMLLRSLYSAVSSPDVSDEYGPFEGRLSIGAKHSNKPVEHIAQLMKMMLDALIKAGILSHVDQNRSQSIAAVERKIKFIEAIANNTWDQATADTWVKIAALGGNDNFISNYLFIIARFVHDGQISAAAVSLMRMLTYIAYHRSAISGAINNAGGASWNAAYGFNNAFMAGVGTTLGEFKTLLLSHLVSDPDVHQAIEAEFKVGPAVLTDDITTAKANFAFLMPRAYSHTTANIDVVNLVARKDFGDAATFYKFAKPFFNAVLRSGALSTHLSAKHDRSAEGSLTRHVQRKNYKTPLVATAVGKVRFDTYFVRNQVFVTNLARVVLASINNALNYDTKEDVIKVTSNNMHLTEFEGADAVYPLRKLREEERD